MALSAQLGCLGIPKPTSMATEFSYFEKITAPLVGRNLWQQFDLFDVSHQRNFIKTNIQRLKQHAFQDAIHLRYGWRLQHLSELCPCAAFFTVDHVLNCHKSGF